MTTRSEDGHAMALAAQLGAGHKALVRRLIRRVGSDDLGDLLSAIHQAEAVLALKDFDPRERRDRLGRWTEGGASGVRIERQRPGGGSAPRTEAEFVAGWQARYGEDPGPSVLRQMREYHPEWSSQPSEPKQAGGPTLPDHAPPNGTPWPSSQIRDRKELRDYLIALSKKFGGAWVASETYGAGTTSHYRSRAAVPITATRENWPSEPLHRDGLAVNGKWIPWTEAQIIRAQQVGSQVLH